MMDLNIRGPYEAIIQPVVDLINQKFTGVAGPAQNNALPSLVKSYAEPLVQLSGSAVIDDRKADLAKILGDYAKNDEKANPKDLNKINAATVKIFQKMTIRQDPNTAAQDRYYKCVNPFVVQSFDATPEFVHDRLLKTEKPHDHPQGISSIAFAFAATLALSVHRKVALQSDLMHNNTSPYFDLSPLYGTNEAETSRIRLKNGSGMLSPDSFAEERMVTLPDSVPVLLVLWNRYHNYVAKQLLLRNEDNKWKDPANLSLERRLAQDNDIFDVARSITCINFMNVVQRDFVNGLIGIPIPGRSARLDILHDVRGITSHKTGYFSSVESYFLYSFSPLAPPSFASTAHERMKQTEDPSADQDLRRRNIGNLRRNKDDCFEDNDLAELLLDATEVKAGSPGGGAAPHWAREQEILKLQQARRVNVCTLNEFRRYLGLKPLESFEEWNPELANMAHDLYDGDINKLELHPGLLCERSTGSGFGFGYTMTWGLIADIVTRIRCDPMFTSKFNEHILTKWGYKDCINDGKESSLGFYSTGGSLGGVLPKLFQRTLPHNYAYDNIYCLFPLVVPEESKAYVKGLPEAIKRKYRTDRPKGGKIKVLRSLKAISEVLNDPETFTSPYKENLVELTGGYGHLLGFDDLTLHDRDLMLTLFSLMPDKGAVRRIGAYFGRKAQENLKRRTLGRGTKKASIDVVKDVVEATCIRWVCETIYGFDFKDSSTWGMSALEVEKARIESREMEKKMREDFAAYYAYIFCNAEPEFGWNAKERALTASKHLREHLKGKLLRYKDDQSDTQFVKAWRFFNQIGEEYTFGSILPRYSAFTFLDRMVKTSHIRPLKRLADTGHLLDAKKKYKEDALGEVVSTGSGTLDEGTLRALFSPTKTLDDHVAEEIARERLEEQRVIANVIGLSMAISVNFSKVCAQVIDFYLDDKYAKEREALVTLCRDKNSTSGEIMGYVWEAQRIGQRFGLWRNVNLAGQPRLIKQDYGYPDVIIEPGDRVFADFTFAHNDPRQVADPEKVDLNRKMISLLGLGMHKCPAGSLIDQTMSQIIRVVFSQEGLKRADGEKGQLKSAILHPNAAPWHPEIYFGEDSHGISHYPTRMVVEFDASNWKDEPVIYNVSKLRRLVQILDRIYPLFINMLLPFLILSFIMSILSPNLSVLNLKPGPDTISCGGPFPPARYWQIEAFRPKWFGLFGEPAPIIFRTPWGRKSHRISVVDIDKRDIEIRVYVDDEDRGHRDVDLDPIVDCGDDISKCLGLGFAAAVVVAPPGRHSVKAEIWKRNLSEAFVWGKERQRRITWVMQPCT